LAGDGATEKWADSAAGPVVRSQTRSQNPATVKRLVTYRFISVKMAKLSFRRHPAATGRAVPHPQYPARIGDQRESGLARANPPGNFHSLTRKTSR
jgi:hypothetical protein